MARLAQRMSVVLLVGVVALSLSACLTMRRGSTQLVEIESSPAGATVTVQPRGQSIETPAHLPMARRFSQTLRFEKPGYQTTTVIVERKASWGLWRNVVWIHPIGWIIGVIVDLSTGSGYDLEPEAVSVELLPLPSAPEVSPPNSD